MNTTRLLWTLLLAVGLIQAQPQVIPGAGTEPESLAVDTGELVYLSGQTGHGPGTKTEAGAQTDMALRKLEAALKRLDLGLDDVVSVNVFLADARHYQEMNQAYRQFFPGGFPARATVETGLDSPESLVKLTAVAARGEKRTIQPEGWPTPAAPYSWGIQTGNHLFVSGVVGTDPVSGSTPGDVVGQARRTFQNVLGVVHSAGLTAADVVSVRVYLADARDFNAMDRVFREFFPTAPPVRATIEARLADPRLRIEVQAVAVSGEKTRTKCGASEAQAFSSAVRAGRNLYLAGMLGHRRGMFAPHAGGQTVDTLENLSACMKEFNSGLTQAVAADVFVSDPRLQPKVDEAYIRMFSEPYPARTAVAAPLMSPEALVEIALIGFLP